MFFITLISLLLGSSEALYSTTSNVIELTPTNFDNLVIKGEEIWIVEFFAPWCGHCRQLVPEYEKAANALRGVIKVGAVNADNHKELAGRYDVRGYPTIKIFGTNKNRAVAEDYTGQRTAQGLIDASLSAAKNKINAQLGAKPSSKQSEGKDVVELTDGNFDKLVLNSDDMWLVEFFAPWCGHCKNLEPHWAEAATQLKGKVKLGALDATEHTNKATEYGIQGFPTIKYFTPGSKDSHSASDYDGGRTAGDIVNWALDKLAENVQPPEIQQVIDEQSFKKPCEEKPLCVISILPHILDCQSDCRNSYLNLLKEMGEKYKKKMWGWLWAEAGAQHELESALDIGGFGYPAMVVVNAKKMKYSVLRGSFSKDGINEFLRDLSYGRGNTAAVKGAELPKIIKTEAWDGKDGELPVEEDIDLSDVILDEKDEL
ncbi:Thioredoxin [Oryctes borbonicus]|uniref:protein disulfide-isomerase n=1 Tax=Oryctes borbonicus TaxID=1629725 RepID=A0A0T6AUF1_9SCAR|nr:Thioredoxin [Oryctes borbonicus]